MKKVHMIETEIKMPNRHLHNNENNFVHLHLHTEYSLLDGVGKITEYVARAKELGMPAIAITDHGNMFGAFEFYKTALKSGIKPIIGMEAYISSGSALEKSGETFHLILLCKNEIGYKNLLKLSSFGYIKGFYYKPRIDKEILKKHSEGLIALSACMKGEIPYYIRKNNMDQAVKSLKEYVEIFGKEDFYIEVQDNGVEGQDILNSLLLKLAKEQGLKAVATNDVHYVHHGDHVLQDILLCLSTGCKVSDEKRMRIDTQELFLKSREQILKKFEGNEEVLKNTLEIAAKCNLLLEAGEFKFPHYDIPDGETSIESYLRTLVKKGKIKRYGENVTDEIKERIEYELSVINKMGYAGYFVVVWDFINYAKTKEIPIGPGRGSAAGSIVAYLLGITDLDPIKYNLIFERFLNPQRISMPDIDIDICQERRQEIIDYVMNKYGTERVAQIITFGTLKAKGAIRDVGRVMNVNLAKIDKVAKMISNPNLAEALKESSDLKEIYNTDEEIKKVIDYSIRLEGKVRHASTHAAGVVISKDPLEDDVPLYMDTASNIAVTQYQMKELEEIGLLKMDFLGLRNLTILKRTTDYIKQNTGKIIEMSDIPIDDKKSYDLLSRGETLGIFQMESDGMRRIIIKLAPDKFEDIIALLALYRPGPLGSGMVEDFINGKHGKGTIKYPHPLLEECLKETYGVILYQEQVMKIANILADYTLGEADLLRRAMGKKISEIMDDNRNKFAERASKKGINPDTAQDIFNLIAKFADYGFNKSHSAAYALVSYWTVYFKANYPAEFFAALMTSEMGDIDKLSIYIEEASKHGIKVFKPDINSSFPMFRAVGDKVVFGLSAIKNIGIDLIKRIVEERLASGTYSDYEDFVYRTKKIGVNRKTLEALTLSGALDSLGGTRQEKIENIDRILDFVTRRTTKESSLQMSFNFGQTSAGEKFKMDSIPEYHINEILRGEKEYVGMYFSGHPMDKYKDKLSKYNFDKSIEIFDEGRPSKTRIVGIIRELKKKITKGGEVMADFLLEDYYGKVKTIIYPKVFMGVSHLLLEHNIVYIEGNTRTNYFNDNEEKTLVVDKMKEIDEIEEARNFSVYILIEENDKYNIDRVKEILLSHHGKDTVILCMKEKNEKHTMKLGERFAVTPSEALIEELESILGEGKVIIK